LVFVSRSKVQKRMTSLWMVELLQEVLEQEIRPRLQTDGRDSELGDVAGNRVIESFRAMCVGCPMGNITVQGTEDKRRRKSTA
jgi:NifU-like protein